MCVKLEQVGGERKLTEEELGKVHRIKAKWNVWMLCRMCGELRFVGRATKYCYGCGYDAMEKVTAKEVA